MQHVLQENFRERSNFILFLYYFIREIHIQVDTRLKQQLKASCLKMISNKAAEILQYDFLLHMIFYFISVTLHFSKQNELLFCVFKRMH